MDNFSFVLIKLEKKYQLRRKDRNLSRDEIGNTFLWHYSVFEVCSVVEYVLKIIPCESNLAATWSLLNQTKQNKET